MLIKFFKHWYRFFSNNRLITFISILGLSFALTLTIHMTLFVKNELSYDRFHKNYDRIYRVLSKFYRPDQEPRIIALCQGQLPFYLKSIPEIESCVRIYDEKAVDIEFDNTRLTNNHLIYADSTFFKIFSFRTLSGNPEETLRDPGSIMISRALAVKAFNSIDVIGRQIKVMGKDLSIGGVLDDIPSNSHLQFDILSGFNDPFLDNLVKHSGGEFLTYILLQKNVEEASTLKKVCDQYSTLAADFWKDTKMKVEGSVQPITDIELHSDNIDWDVQHGNIRNIYLAVVLIVFMLIVAVINFINLFTVSAETRIKEIGIRKVSGASRFDMIKQYMGETVSIVFFSLFLAIFLAYLSWPVFNSLTGKNIHILELFSVDLLAFFLLLSIFTGIIAGIYPALWLSRFSVIKVFKGTSSKGRHNNALIKSMVVFQFLIVIFLVSCLLVFYRQMSYIKNANLGFNKESVIAVKGLNKTICNGYDVIRNKLLQKNGILNVCLAQGITGNTMSGQYAGRIGSPEDEGVLVKHTRTTEDFINTFGIRILRGRDFNNLLPTDKKNYIINETAEKALGFEEGATGQMMAMNDTGYVIAVVRDFNFASLHNKVEPLIITLNDLTRGIVRGTIYVRVNPVYIHDVLEYLAQSVKSVDPLYNLDYEFIDDTFGNMYLQEQKISSMLLISTIISILLAMMGLIALTSFSILRRTKEIGIRKVNGARFSEVLILLNKDFLRSVTVSLIFALPASLFVMQQWLKNFAYTSGTNWWIYFLSGLFVFGMTLITVSCVSWNTARKNPVETLRYE